MLVFTLPLSYNPSLFVNCRWINYYKMQLFVNGCSLSSSIPLCTQSLCLSWCWDGFQFGTIGFKRLLNTSLTNVIVNRWFISLVLLLGHKIDVCFWNCSSPKWLCCFPALCDVVPEPRMLANTGSCWSTVLMGTSQWCELVLPLFFLKIQLPFCELIVLSWTFATWQSNNLLKI